MADTTHQDVFDLIRFATVEWLELQGAARTIESGGYVNRVWTSDFGGDDTPEDEGAFVRWITQGAPDPTGLEYPAAAGDFADTSDYCVETRL